MKHNRYAHDGSRVTLNLDSGSVVVIAVATNTTWAATLAAALNRLDAQAKVQAS